MIAITIREATWQAIAASSLGWDLIEPPRSPYGHRYLWLDPNISEALHYARRPLEGFDEAILRLIAEERNGRSADDGRDAG